MSFKLIVICLFVSPVLALASSGETKSVVFRGQPRENMDLRGVISHTEYRTETYQATCYNTVLDHYETRCVNEPITVCYDHVPNMISEGRQLVPGPSNPKDGGHEPGPGPVDGGGLTPGPSHPKPDPDPGPVCHTEWREVCSQYPVYVDIPYACTKTRQVPYEVKDGDALNHVLLNFGPVPTGVTPNDTFNVSASGNDIAVNVQSTSDALYSMTQSTVQNSKKGTLVETTTTVNVKIESVSAINAAVTQGLTQLTATTNGVTFTLGKVLRPELLVISLKIKQDQLLGSKTLIDRELRANEFTLTNVGEQTRVTVGNAILGLKSNRKFKITARARLTAPAGLANPGSISSARPEQTVKVKL